MAVQGKRLGLAILFMSCLAMGVAPRVASAQAGPPPPPPPPPNPLDQLGRALFVDPTLSNPRGQSCSTCHAAQTGWSNSNSKINQEYGPVPGAVAGRFGNRRPPSIGYASFMKDGPPTFDPGIGAFVGGFFYDGRAATLTAQVSAPLENPNEMNNTPAGVVKAVAAGPNAALFQQAFGESITKLTVDEAFADIVLAIVTFESSHALAPFNSKYDDFVDGEVKLTAQELAGLQLFTGSLSGRPGGPRAPKHAGCSVCHTIEATSGVSPDLFTNHAFRNTGIPKNPTNPFYKQTNAATDPLGYNPLGAAYIDIGLGDFLYPLDSLPSGNMGRGSNGKGDFLAINGTFKVPTLRNVDTRPQPDFVKCYGHNGFFKSLAEVVHFYNTRNLTTVPGEVINFDLPKPYANLKGKPLWPAPENLDPQTLVNPTGSRQGLVGNLGLTPQDEANLVAFLQTLSDAPPSQPPPPPPPPPPAP